MSELLLLMSILAGIIVVQLICVWRRSLEVERLEQARLLRAQVAQHEAQKRRWEAEQAAQKREEQARREAEERQRREQEHTEVEERNRKGIFDLRLRPGLESFTRVPLEQGRLYWITVTGTYEYRHWGWHRADACYHAPEVNFSDQYKKFFIDGGRASTRTEDRHLHSYCFPYTGTGKKLSILLKPAGKDDAETRGTLSVLITPLAPEELAAREQARREAEERQRKEEEERHAKALERRRLREIARQQQESRKRDEMLREQEMQRLRREESRSSYLESKFTHLRMRTDFERNYFDLQYRENLARYKTEEILGEMDEFFEEYSEIMSDADLLSMIEAQAPRVLDWLKARHEVFLLAEQFASARAARFLENKSPTERQIRAAIRDGVKRKARRISAKKLGLLDSVVEFSDQLGRYNMDEDQQTRELQDLVDELETQDKPARKRIE